ncbi:redoxin domain-containing protein [Ferrimonas balearica]|nr:redoxin domain-containing protein [Ferrimonas balearica]
MLKNFRKPATDVRPRRIVPQAKKPTVQDTSDTWVEVPKDYTAAAKWTPSIDEYFPNFSGISTEGRITFHPYVSGRWTIFFSIADAFSETCTRELCALAPVQDDLRREGVRLIGVARNPVEELDRWRDEIHLRSGHRVSIPIIADTDGILTNTFGMIHPLQAEASAIRKTIIIDPNLRVSMLFEYPLYISRSMEETLRTLDAARGFYEEQDAVIGGY